jgi:hypothetical protein
LRILFRHSSVKKHNAETDWQVRVTDPPLHQLDQNSVVNRVEGHHDTLQRLQHFPERVIITRPHHPFDGQSLEVLRQARMPAGLQFVLILQARSKSLISAHRTDFKVRPWRN